MFQQSVVGMDNRVEALESKVEGLISRVAVEDSRNKGKVEEVMVSVTNSTSILVCASCCS